MVGIGSIWLRIEPVEGSCERGNEPSGSIKRWEVLEWLHIWQLLKKGSAPGVSEWLQPLTISHGLNRFKLCIIFSSLFSISPWHFPEYIRSIISVEKGKAIPVTDHEGPYGCETSRLSHFVDNRLTDGGKVVRLKRRPPFTLQEDPGTHFC
jgi:hypothetical protein